MADIPELELLGGFRPITFDLAKFPHMVSSFVMHHTEFCSSLVAYENKLEIETKAHGK